MDCKNYLDLTKCEEVRNGYDFINCIKGPMNNVKILTKKYGVLCGDIVEVKNGRMQCIIFKKEIDNKFVLLYLNGFQGLWKLLNNGIVFEDEQTAKKAFDKWCLIENV